MGGLRFVQRMLDYLQKLVDGYLYRKEKKNGAVHGDDDTVRKARRTISYTMVGAIILLIVAMLIREGAFLSSDFFIDREIPSAPRQKLTINDKITQTDLDIIRDATSSKSGQDCRSMSARLQETGSLNSADKEMYLKECIAGMDKALGGVISKVLTNDLSADTAKKVLSGLSVKNAQQTDAALENQEVIKALKSDSGSSIAEALPTLSSLKPEEASKAAKIIANTPPQFRQTSISAIKDISAVQSPDARKSLLDSLETARSPEDINLVKNFAREVKNLNPDEQKITTDAFVKTATPEAKKAFTEAVKNIAKIDKDDPVRGRLIEGLTQIPNLKPEDQGQAAQSIAGIASNYANEKDPAKRQAIADSFSGIKTPSDINGLADRLATLDTLKGLPVKDKDVSNYLLGKDVATLQKINAASDALGKGAGDDSKKILTGDIRAEESKYQTTREKTQTETNAAALNDKLSDAEKSLAKTRNEIKKSEAEVISIKGLSLPATDPVVVHAYAKLGNLKEEEKTRLKAVEEARASLVAKIEEIKNRASTELSQVGVAMPNIIIPVSKNDEIASLPAERLTDLRDTPGFFDSQSAKRKAKRLMFGEFGSDGESTTTSLLAHAVSKMPKSWTVSGGPGISGQSDKVASFEMSRTQFAPGIVLRIPPNGIPSDKVSKYTIFFKFIGAVPDRKTGKIAIPSGSIALCKVQDFDKNTGKLSAKCDRVDIGGPSDIETDLVLNDADGSDGLTGAITDNRGWYLAGVFMTAFTAAVLDNYSKDLTAPYESKSQKTLGDYTAQGSISGAALIARDIADKQIEEWQKAPYYWHSFDGALATVRQN
jgi:hypothetical protein